MRTVLVEETVEEVVMKHGAVEIDEESGRMKTQSVRRFLARACDFTALKDLFLRSRVDVGATTYFSEIAMTQTLDKLRRTV